MTDYPPPPQMPPTPPPLGMPYGGAGQPPSNNLVLAILTTVLCCVPLGIWGIVSAASVNGKWERGDFAGAQAAAALAKKVSIIGMIGGFVVIALYIALIVTGTISASSSSTY